MNTYTFGSKFDRLTATNKLNSQRITVAKLITRKALGGMYHFIICTFLSVCMFVRCGMVYMDPSELGWRPYVKSWMQRTCKKMKEETQVFFL